MPLRVPVSRTMTGYNEILLSHVRILRRPFSNKFHFMDDNMLYEIAPAVQHCLESEYLKLLVGSSCSLDVNPIENVCGVLGECLVARKHHSTSKGINC